MRAGAAVSLGTVVWGLAAGLGLGALLAVSETAYAVLQVAGAAYLLWLGLGMMAALKGGGGFAPDLTAPATAGRAGSYAG